MVKRRQKGFTLIELLIVVAILGILMAVVIPNVATFMRSGEKAAAQAELSTVQTAIFAAMADHGLGEINGQTAISDANGEIDTTDPDPNTDISTFLGALLAKIQGTWSYADTGYITSGTYGGWVYTAANTPAWTYP